MREYHEKLINAFLNNLRLKDVAAAAGVSLTTVKKLKNDPEFVSILDERRTAIVRLTVDKMTERLIKDADMLQEIIDDRTVNPAVRVTAISEKWKHLREWKTLTDFENRLKALETAYNAQIKPFKVGDDTE